MPTNSYSYSLNSTSGVASYPKRRSVRQSTRLMVAIKCSLTAFMWLIPNKASTTASTCSEFECHQLLLFVMYTNPLGINVVSTGPECIASVYSVVAISSPAADTIIIRVLSLLPVLAISTQVLTFASNTAERASLSTKVLSTNKSVTSSMYDNTLPSVSYAVSE